MFKRDYLQNQLEQLARAIGNLLAELLGTTLEKDPEILSETEESLNTLLGVKSVSNLEDKDFLSLLKTEDISNEATLGKLADLLFEIGTRKKLTGDGTGARKYLQKATLLYEHLCETSTTYSFEWVYRIEEIKKSLESE